MKNNISILTIVFVGIFSVSVAQKTTTSQRDSCCKVPIELSPRSGTRFYVDFLCDVRNFEFKLFNKWGEALYSTTGIESPVGFDISEKIMGKRKEKEKYPVGNYIWVARYQVKVGDTLIEKHSAGLLTIKH